MPASKDNSGLLLEVSRRMRGRDIPKALRAGTPQFPKTPAAKTEEKRTDRPVMSHEEAKRRFGYGRKGRRER